MSPEELDAIRARCEKATKGPWNASAHLSGTCYGWDWQERFSAFNVAPHIASGTRGGKPGDDGLPQAIADAEFIAHARSDVPALLDLIEEFQQGRTQ